MKSTAGLPRGRAHCPKAGRNGLRHSSKKGETRKKREQSVRALLFVPDLVETIRKFKVKWVIPLGLEPRTHALEGRCSNPTELRNQTYRGKVLLCGCKYTYFLRMSQTSPNKSHHLWATSLPRGAI